jgi:hypothetical protein
VLVLVLGLLLVAVLVLVLVTVLGLLLVRVLVAVLVLVLVGMLVLAGVLLMLVTVLMFACAGPDSREPATATRGRTHQASTTHADMVHLRTMVLLPSWDQRRALLAGRRGQWA